MEYKASLDTLAKVITVGVFILFAVLGYRSVKALTVSQGDTTTILIHSGILLFFITTIVGCYLFAPQSYTLDNTDFTIVRPASNKKIKLSEIAEIRIVADTEMTGAIRTFGVGGLFGYYGKYYTSKIGSMTFYATQRKNKIFILTKQGQKIIITPDDISIIEQLKEKSSTNL